MLWFTRLSSKLEATSSTLFKNLTPKTHPTLKQKPSISDIWGFRSLPNYSKNLYIVKHYSNKYGGPNSYRKVLGAISLYVPRKTCIYSPKKHQIPFWVQCVIVGVGVVLYETCETIPYTNRIHFVLLRPSDEKKKAEFFFILKKNKLGLLPEEHPDSVRVKSIGEQIVKALESDLEAIKGKSWKKPTVDHLVGIKWEFLVVNDPNNINGYSFPGGKIWVSTGLLKHLQSDADIATFIGHEVGHIVARHQFDGLDKLAILLANKFLGLAISIPKMAEHIPDGVSELGRVLFTYPRLRRNEREADYIGLLLMASAGFDPQEAPKVYLISDELSSSSSAAAAVASKSDFYHTHPSGKKRAEYLAKAKVMEQAKSIYSKTMESRKMNGMKDR